MWNGKRLGFKFQFHIGSIKSYYAAAYAADLSLVSIPHWFN